MITSVSPLVIGAFAFFVIGGGWLYFYWHVLDPWLRRMIGRMVNATINTGEQHIWVANQESEDSISWRAAIIRPLQLLSMMLAGMVALMIGLVVTLWLSG